jgi:hypothetical protein
VEGGVLLLVNQAQKMPWLLFMIDGFEEEYFTTFQRGVWFAAGL